mgnify:CR=1 FL=1
MSDLAAALMHAPSDQVANCHRASGRRAPKERRPQNRTALYVCDFSYVRRYRRNPCNLIPLMLITALFYYNFL